MQSALFGNVDALCGLLFRSGRASAASSFALVRRLDPPRARRSRVSIRRPRGRTALASSPRAACLARIACAPAGAGGGRPRRGPRGRANRLRQHAARSMGRAERARRAVSGWARGRDFEALRALDGDLRRSRPIIRYARPRLRIAARLRGAGSRAETPVRGEPRRSASARDPLQRAEAHAAAGEPVALEMSPALAGPAASRPGIRYGARRPLVLAMPAGS
jgi:hypothetical protein